MARDIAQARSLKIMGLTGNSLIQSMQRGITDALAEGCAIRIQLATETSEYLRHVTALKGEETVVHGVERADQRIETIVREATERADTPRTIHVVRCPGPRPTAIICDDNRAWLYLFFRRTSFCQGVVVSLARVDGGLLGDLIDHFDRMWRIYEPGVGEEASAPERDARQPPADAAPATDVTEAMSRLGIMEARRLDQFPPDVTGRAIRGAKSQIRVIGFSGASFFQDFEGHLTAALSRGCELRVILIDPESDLASEAASVEPPDLEAIRAMCVIGQQRLLAVLAEARRRAAPQDFKGAWLARCGTARPNMLICDDSVGWCYLNLPPRQHPDAVTLSARHEKGGLLEDLSNYFETLWAVHYKPEEDPCVEVMRGAE